MNTTPAAQEADDHLFLFGRPPVTEVIGAVLTLAVDARRYSEGELMAEWRTANDRIRELERIEAGIADGAAPGPLPPELEALAESAKATPLFRRAFQMVSTEIAMVELDRLVVFQKHINLSQVRRIRERLDENPSAEDVFHTCISVNPQRAPVRALKTAPNAYTFVSPSNDLRFIEPVLLDPDQLVNPMAAAVTSIVGLVVGYGPNIVNAMHVENRLVLGNGSHRVFALREHGVTHVPCAVQKVTRREELEVVGPEGVRMYPDRYLTAPRPSMLKDYFDPLLRKIVPLPRKNHAVKVMFNVERAEIPA